MPISKMFLSLFDVPKAQFQRFETAQVTQAERVPESPAVQRD